MKLDWRLVLILVLSLGLVVNCESTEDDDDATPAFKVLTDYMVANDYDATSIVANWITTAAVVSEAGVENYFILDIRASGDYANGHIAGAVNSAYADVLTTVETDNTSDLPILVVCYTGQTAAHAVVALRLSGYTDAKVLKWGMSGWNSGFDSWTGNVNSIAVDNANWSTAAAPAFLSGNDDPVITTTQTEGAAILAERVDAILAEFKATPPATILDAPENYEILNYWEATDYEHYGHIDGAYQITPGTLTIANDGLDILDPSQTIATYCWTGQTSSMMTAWLTALGYDATSLKFGANGLIYSALEEHKWSAVTEDLPVE